MDLNWNILVIDDSKLNRAVIKKVLTDIGMNIVEANDGIEGLEKLENLKFDLVLVDIIMPRLDGFGFLSKFKNVIGDDFIPVILMTGSDDLNSKIKGLRIGADDFLIKPLNEKELVARVFSLIRLKSMHQELYQKNELIKRELEAAKKVQQYIIPKDFSHIQYPKISGRYIPIEEIGGDYFDCFVLPENKYGFLMADVTGHGIAAALVMSMSRMIFSIYASQYDSPDKLMQVVNNQMRGLLLDYQYITAFYTIFDAKTMKLNLTNAGHVLPLYFRASKNKVISLDAFGWFIGIADNSEYETKYLLVEKGDRLFLFTDGITEIKNYKGEEFGEKRLAQFIKGNILLKGDDFCETLLKEINTFANLDERNDDIAFLNIEF